MGFPNAGWFIGYEALGPAKQTNRTQLFLQQAVQAARHEFFCYCERVDSTDLSDADYLEGVSEVREKLHASLTGSGASFVTQEQSRMDARLESSVSEGLLERVELGADEDGHDDDGDDDDGDDEDEGLDEDEDGGDGDDSSALENNDEPHESAPVREQQAKGCLGSQMGAVSKLLPHCLPTRLRLLASPSRQEINIFLICILQ